MKHAALATRNVVLFYASVTLLVVTAIAHVMIDVPESMADYLSNIAIFVSVVFMLAMTCFVFRPQIHSTAETLAQMKLLKTVATAANEAETANEGLQVAIDMICAYTKWPVGHVCIYSESNDTIVSSGVWHVSDHERVAEFRAITKAMQLPVRQGFVGEVFTDSTPMWILDVAHSSVHTRKDAASAAGLKAALAFPIFVGRKAVAVMEFYTYDSAIPDEQMLGVMANIGKQLGQTIEREHTMKTLKRANLKAEAAARDLEESLRKAEEANKAKSDFLANMSHELRTPMNGVLGMAQLLGDSRLDTEQKELVDTINSSGENLLMLLNDILDFSKIEAGALVLEKMPYSLQEAIDQTRLLLAPNAEKKGITLITDVDPEIPPYLLGDGSRMRQVIINLVGNSIKFTHAGYVHVTARLQEYAQGERLQVLVEDTGIGIPAEKLNEIFEKFTQADASVTRKYGGTGLGLAITKQLIQLMGGEMGVQSVEGKGSTFWFSVPCEEATYCNLGADYKMEPVLREEGTRVTVAQARVLLVEDYPVNQVFAQKLLKKFGFTQIDLAENGLEAIEKCKHGQYDVIFMDCQMPEMDGYQATGQIRILERDSARRTPIIAMTANAMMGDREKCLKAGMDDYTSKPLRAQHLRAILQRLFVLEGATGTSTPHAAHVAPAEQKTAEESAMPAVDLEQLRMFTDGDPEEEKALAMLFLDQAAQSIAQLSATMQAGANEAWKSAAHRFKGASGNLGATTLHHLCKRAEQHAEDDVAAKQEMLTAIVSETKRVETFFSTTH